MSDRVFLSILAVAAVVAIVLAALWPQGYGARSPAPFGHTPIQQTPEMQAAMARETAHLKAKKGERPDSAAITGLRPSK
ncbi:hypothetical protein [Phenylobacterium montanum]|uniref:Uncharacterized protein n=1 Tax=Phenylobacterium montanum TaxID=2823693 RepID=A0A975FYF4_9CAUL|nr:hypothetical protein [Caulobacter sp. S6]QUD87499.1 hypothetical protein KCG34_20975 [Caulobacter sp. S6]